MIRVEFKDASGAAADGSTASSTTSAQATRQSGVHTVPGGAAVVPQRARRPAVRPQQSRVASSSDSRGTLQGQFHMMLSDLVDGWGFPQFHSVD